MHPVYLAYFNFKSMLKIVTVISILSMGIYSADQTAEVIVISDKIAV